MRRLRLTLALLIGLSALSGAWADEDFDRLKREYDEAQQAWFKQMQQAQSDDGTVEADKLPPHPSEVFLPRFEAYAKKHTGKPEAIGALAWIIQAGSRGGAGGEGGSPAEWAVEQLREHHAADPAIGQELPRLRYAYYHVGKEPLIALYERVIAVNKDQDAAAWALFNLGFTLYRGADEPAADEKRSSDKERAAQLFGRCVKEYSGRRAAERAAGYIYEIEHLQIGMAAPEIVGTDVDGNEIKLSQFRGRVVVLDFWGFW